MAWDKAAIAATLTSAVSAANLVAAGAKAVSEAVDQLGVIEDDVTVVVQGAPNCDRQVLYQMAASIGFGLVHRLGLNGIPIDVIAPGPLLGAPLAVGRALGLVEGVVDLPPPGMIAISYDAADNEVTFKLKYKTSLVNALVTAEWVPGRPRADVLSGSLPVLTGPAPEVKGGEWNFTGPLIGGAFAAIPVTPLKTPTLSKTFANRVLLTKRNSNDVPVPLPDGAPFTDKSGLAMNPRLYGDARSRGALIEMVYSALSTPGSDKGILQNPGLSADNFENTFDAFRGK